MLFVSFRSRKCKDDQVSLCERVRPLHAAGGFSTPPWKCTRLQLVLPRIFPNCPQSIARDGAYRLAHLLRSGLIWRWIDRYGARSTFSSPPVLVEIEHSRPVKTTLLDVLRR